MGRSGGKGGGGVMKNKEMNENKNLKNEKKKI